MPPSWRTRRNEMDEIRPVKAWLTTNRSCNFRCQWCYHKAAGYQTNDMCLFIARELIKVLQELQIRQTILLGGEPTLWPHLLDANKLLAQARIKSTLVTNGFRFGDDKFWESYLEAPNSLIYLSLKAANPKQLKQAAKVRDFKFLSKALVRVAQSFEHNQFSLTYNKFYQANLPELVQYAVDCGAKSVEIGFCTASFSGNRTDDSICVPAKELVSAIVRDYPRLDQITKGKLVLEMSVPFCFWPDGFIQELKSKNQIISVCHVLKKEGVVFDTDGKLLMCNSLHDYPLGRFTEDFCSGVGLIRHLNQPKIRAYYQRMTSYPSLACQECGWFDQCGGGCPLRWAQSNPAELVHPVSEASKLLAAS